MKPVPFPEIAFHRKTSKTMLNGTGAAPSNCPAVTGAPLAYSTNAYTNFPLSYAIYEIKRLGFNGVEILADIPHAFPCKLSTNKVNCLKKLLTNLKLHVSNINANTCNGLNKRNPRNQRGKQDEFWPGLVEKQKEDRDLRIRYIKECINLACELGAENVCISSGRLPCGTPEEKGLDILCKSLGQIVEYAGKKRIKVGIEYEPGLFVDNSGTLLKVLDRVDSPILGANLDIGHSKCANEDTAQVIKRLAGRIWNIHIEDIKGRVHKHLILGEGDIDFRSIFATLEKIGYDRFVTLELYPYKDNPSYAGKKSLAYISQRDTRLNTT